MITTRSRGSVSVVSLAIVLSATLVADACARGPSPVVTGSTPAEQPLLIRFDNDARTYVDVYLVGETRERWLGRVAPGAHSTLRIPRAAEPMFSGFVRLAVLAGSPLSMQAAREPRAMVTVAQPAAELLRQQWTFSQTQSALPDLRGTPTTLGQPR
jgi:hypothetical protein